MDITSCWSCVKSAASISAGQSFVCASIRLLWVRCCWVWKLKNDAPLRMILTYAENFNEKDMNEIRRWPHSRRYTSMGQMDRFSLSLADNFCWTQRSRLSISSLPSVCDPIFSRMNSMHVERSSPLLSDVILHAGRRRRTIYIKRRYIYIWPCPPGGWCRERRKNWKKIKIKKL